MKRLTAVVLTIILIMVFCAPADAQILWRGAKTMNQGSVITMAEWYLMNYTNSYDWTNEEWVDFPDDQKSLVWGFETMFGYAVTDNWEAMIHVPIVFKSSETPTLIPTIPPTTEITKLDASGIGDIYLKTRYAVIPWAKDHHGVTLTGALRFPTGDEEADIALGDGGTDIGLGGMFSSAWMGGKHRGHLKANYWINGENDDSLKTKTGNQLKVLVKYDYNLSEKVMPFLVYSFLSQGETENDGNSIDNTNITRHVLILGANWNLKTGMVVRPKLAFPIGGEGGSIYGFEPVLDFWYIFQL